MENKRPPPISEIRADNRRFHNLLASLSTALSHKGSAKVIGISCRDALPVWVEFRAGFFETGALSACLAFCDVRVFPWDQRGNPGSRNNELGIAIWAESGLVWYTRLCVERISSCQ